MAIYISKSIPIGKISKFEHKNIL
jgi:Na+/H+ antiporter NhaC